MKLKKVMALTLAAVLSLSALAGCGKDDRPASGENNNKEQTEENQKKSRTKKREERREEWLTALHSPWRRP